MKSYSSYQSIAIVKEVLNNRHILCANGHWTYSEEKLPLLSANTLDIQTCCQAFNSGTVSKCLTTNLACRARDLNNRSSIRMTNRAVTLYNSLTNVTNKIRLHVISHEGDRNVPLKKYVSNIQMPKPACIYSNVCVYHLKI